MAQRTKLIDLTRSYLPIDPNSFPETMHGTEGEDRPEKLPPVLPYEGWNFMPTGYGYRSYFGITTKLDIDNLPEPAKCREVFCFQKNDLSNVLIALHDAGIYTKQGETTGAWTLSVAMTDPVDGTVLEWSHCVIENKLYVYRQGEAQYHEFSDAVAYVWTARVPTTLNMAGQLGIFGAGGRLGFWDSANSIAYSAFDSHTFFTPDIGRGSNITTLTHVMGRIINIVQQGEGFVVYATKSIVGVRKNPDNTFLWQAVPITKAAGISYRNQVALANPDTVHFVWSSVGLMKVENFAFEVVATEFYDFLKEQQVPVFIKFLEGRYLVVQVSAEEYVDGLITFYTQTVAPLDVSLSYTIAIMDELDEDDLDDAVYAVTALHAIQRNTSHIWAFNQPGGCSVGTGGQCTGKDYPVYKEYFRIVDLFNGPTQASPQAGLLSVVANYAQIEANINAATFSDMQFNLFGMTNLITDSPYPCSALFGVTEVSTVVNPVTLITEESLAVSAYPAENVAQQSGEVVFIEDAEGTFYNRFNAICAIYEKFCDAFYAKTKNKILPYNGRQTAAKTNVATTAVGLACSITGAVTPSQISVPERIRTTISVPATINATRTYFTVQGYDRLLKEYGLYNNEIPWAFARPGRYRSLACGYDATKEIVAAFLRFTVTAGAGEGYFGFVQADVPIVLPDVASAGEAEAILTAAIASAQITLTANNPGDVVSLLTSAAGVTTRPYADKDGNVATDAIVAPKTVRFTCQSDASRVDITLHATSLRSIDTFRVTDGTSDQLGGINPMLVPCTKEKLIEAFAYPNSYVAYNAVGQPVVSATVSPYAGITAAPYGALADTTRNTVIGTGICSVAPATVPSDYPQFNQATFSPDNFTYIPVDFVLGADAITFSYSTVSETFTFPAIDFLMQEGAPVPYDQEWLGAYVYDLQLKRWGKMKQIYRQLLDFYPINSTSVGVIPFTNFGVQAAMLNDAGELRFFDMIPTDSYIKYGKVGLFRHGFTTLEQLRVDMRQSVAGTLEVETSLDGKTIDLGLTKTFDYDGLQLVQGLGNSGRWHNLAFRGQFDLSYLEFVGYAASRR